MYTECRLVANCDEDIAEHKLMVIEKFHHIRYLKSQIGRQEEDNNTSISCLLTEIAFCT